MSQKKEDENQKIDIDNILNTIISTAKDLKKYSLK